MSGVLSEDENFLFILRSSLEDAASHEPSEECLELSAAAFSGPVTNEQLLGGLRAEQWDTRALACMLVVLVDSHHERDYGLREFRSVLDGPRQLALLSVIEGLTLVVGYIQLDLGYSCDAELYEELRVLLSDSSAVVRQRSAFALGVAGPNDEYTRRTLENLITQDPLGSAVVGGLLGRTWLDDPEPVLLRAQRTDPDWRVRACASWLLGFRGGEDPIALRDTRDEVKAIGLSMSSGATAPALIAEVQSLARDPRSSPAIRCSAAVNLFGREDRELSATGAAFLRQFDGDPDFAQQQRMIDYFLLSASDPGEAKHGRE